MLIFLGKISVVIDLPTLTVYEYPLKILCTNREHIQKPQIILCFPVLKQNMITSLQTFAGVKGNLALSSPVGFLHPESFILDAIDWGCESRDGKKSFTPPPPHCGQPTESVTWFHFLPVQKLSSGFQTCSHRGCWPQSKSTYLIQSLRGLHTLHLSAGKTAVQLGGLRGALLLSHRKKELAQRCIFWHSLLRC